MKAASWACQSSERLLVNSRGSELPVAAMRQCAGQWRNLAVAFGASFSLHQPHAVALRILLSSAMATKRNGPTLLPIAFGKCRPGKTERPAEYNLLALGFFHSSSNTGFPPSTQRPSMPIYHSSYSTKWPTYVRNPSITDSSKSLTEFIIATSSGTWRKGQLTLQGREAPCQPQPSLRHNSSWLYGPPSRNRRPHHGYAPRQYSSPQNMFADVQSDVCFNPTPHPSDIAP